MEKENQFVEVFSNIISISFSDLKLSSGQILSCIDCNYNILFEYRDEEIISYAVNFFEKGTTFLYVIGFLQVKALNGDKTHLKIIVPNPFEKVNLDPIKFEEKKILLAGWKKRKEIDISYSYVPEGFISWLWVSPLRIVEAAFGENEEIEELIYGKLFIRSPLSEKESITLQNWFNVYSETELIDIFSSAHETAFRVSQLKESEIDKIRNELSLKLLDHQTRIMRSFIDELRKAGIWLEEDYGGLLDFEGFGLIPPMKKARQKRRKNVKVQRRRKKIKVLYENHPEWTYEKIAQEVTDLEINRIKRNLRQENPTIADDELEREAIAQFRVVWSGKHRFTKDDVNNDLRKLGIRKRKKISK